MPEIILRRAPTTDNKILDRVLMPLAVIEMANIVISSAVSVYGEAMLENKSRFSHLDIVILTIAASIGITTLVSILAGISTLIYSEGRLASESIRTKLPIGDVVLCHDEDDIKHIYQIRNLPFVHIPMVCPLVISQPRNQLIHHLQVSNDAPVLVRDYTLEDVADTKQLGAIVGGFHSVYFAVPLLFMVDLKNSNAAVALIFAALLISFPINMFCFSNLFKASISLYSSISDTQFKGCFFSRPATAFRQTEVDELHAPLLIEGRLNMTA